VAWTDPRTWATAEIVLVSHFNANIRDALRETSRLLARTSYNPDPSTTYTRAAATFADVDATNLSAAFTVPYSGKVLVRLSAWVSISSATHQWGLRESSSDVTDSATAVKKNPAATVPRRVEADIIITGLTANDSKTWKWSLRSEGAGDTATIYVGGTTYGPATMQVWSIT
jgi:hypothetical protein